MEALQNIRNPIGLRLDSIAPSTTIIHAKQHNPIWSSSIFTVTTPSNTSDPEPARKLFEITGTRWSLSQRRHIQDASGLPLYELSRPPITDLWHLHLPGEKERKEHDKRKENTWASPATTRPIATIIPKYNTSSDGKFEVHFRNAVAANTDFDLCGDIEKEVKLTVRVQNAWKGKAQVLNRERVVMDVRLVDVAAVYVPGMSPCWEGRVMEGMDLALASVIVVLLATAARSSSVSAGGGGGG